VASLWADAAGGIGHNPPTPGIKRTIWSVEGNVSLCADLTPKELEGPWAAGHPVIAP
jgi:hypothetical protein